MPGEQLRNTAFWLFVAPMGRESLCLNMKSGGDFRSMLELFLVAVVDRKDVMASRSMLRPLFHFSDFSKGKEWLGKLFKKYASFLKS